MKGRLSTIGYEGRTLAAFVGLLRKEEVTLVCDVRRTPLSRRRGFSKGPLARALAEAEIRYEHLPELGIAAERRKNLKNPDVREALFDEYARDDLPRQAKALARIAAWIKEGGHVVLLCFERDPALCHRQRIADALAARHGCKPETF